MEAYVTPSGPLSSSKLRRMDPKLRRNFVRRTPNFVVTSSKLRSRNPNFVATSSKLLRNFVETASKLRGARELISQDLYSEKIKRYACLFLTEKQTICKGIWQSRCLHKKHRLDVHWNSAKIHIITYMCIDICTHINTYTTHTHTCKMYSIL